MSHGEVILCLALLIKRSTLVVGGDEVIDDFRLHVTNGDWALGYQQDFGSIEAFSKYAQSAVMNGRAIVNYRLQANNPLCSLDSRHWWKRQQSDPRLGPVA